MKVRRYLAENYPEAMSQVKAELGIDAVILHTRTISQGGFFGLFGKKMIEVTAALEDEALLHTPPKAAMPIISGRRQLAEGAYRGSPARPPDEARTDEYTPQHLSDFLDRFRDSFGAEEIVSGPRAAQAVAADPELPALRAELGRQLNAASAPASPPPAATITPVAPVAAPAETEQLQDIRRELAQTQVLLRQVVEQREDDKSNKTLEMPRYARRLWKQLVSNDVDADLATELINGVLAECQADNEQELEEKLRKRILELMRYACRPDEPPPLPQIIALVGPTGVGKTTTLAKLAANKALVEKKRVGLITIDTYRIAAVEQLKTYAKILDLQVQVVYTPQELPQVLAQMSDCEIVFIDTAGRSHKNAMQMSELKAFFEVGKPSQAYLVLSLTTKFSDMMEIIAQYEPLSLDTLIFTKLDETTSYGNLFNIAVLLQKRIAFLSDGQNVPDDITVADPFELTDLVMGKRAYA